MLDNFFTDVASGAFKVTKQTNYMTTAKRIMAFEESYGKPMEQGYTREEYVALFTHMQIRRRNYFAAIRGMVSQYANYLVLNGYLSENHVDMVKGINYEELGFVKGTEAKTLFFRNLDELEAAIQKSVSEDGSYDEHKFDCPSCVAYLTWFGFTKQEIMGLKKEDVLPNGVMHNGMLLPLPNHLSALFWHYRNAEGYYQKARGVILRKYVPTEYFFRTEKNDRLTHEDRVTEVLYRLNEVCNRKYSLQYDAIWKSGMLNRIYMRELTSGQLDLDNLANDIPFASALFEMPLERKDQVIHLVEDYRRYKRLISEN